MHVRASSNAINFRQFLMELCPFLTSNCYKYAVFRTFLLHALTFRAEILHMTLFYCTTEQVWVSSISVNFCWSYAPFGTKNTENTQFSALFSYMLWHIQLKFCIWLCFTVLQIKFQCCQFPSIFVGVMPLLERRILEIHSFPHFPLTRFDILSWNFAFDFVLLYYRSIKFQCCQFPSIFVGVMPLLERRILEIHSFPHFSLTSFDILGWNFAYDFVLLYYRSSSSVVNFRQFLWELCPFWNVENWKYTVFRTLFLHALTYWAEILHLTFTVLEIKFECRQFPSIFVGVMPLLEPRILEYTIFRNFLLHALIYQAEILHMTFFYCTKIKFQCCQFPSIFVGVMPLLELRILKIGFRTFLLHALTYWTAILHMTLFKVRVS